MKRRAVFMSENQPKFNSRGFGLVDFIIIGALLAILAFVVISNIASRAY